MKTDRKGSSTTTPGKEQIEEFIIRGERFIQYDYRTRDGHLFSCVSTSVEEARSKRDEWIVDVFEK